MANLSANPHEVGERSIAPRTSLIAPLLDDICADAETNQSSTAHVLGITEQTLRRLRNGENRPSFDRVVEMCAASAPLKLKVLVLIADGGFAIVPVEIPGDLTPADQVQKLRELVVELHQQATAMDRVVTAALRDQRIDGAENADIAAAAAQVSQTATQIAASATAVQRRFTGRHR